MNDSMVGWCCVVRMLIVVYFKVLNISNVIWCINDKYCFLCRLAAVKMFGKMLLM